MTASRKWLVAGVLVVYGCAHPGAHEEPDPLQGYSLEAVAAGDVRDFRNIYKQMGIIGSPPPISFVANPAYFASQSVDTTLMVLSISLPNRGLTFQHDGPMFRAEYEVDLVVRHDSADVQRMSAIDTVRVATLKETNRTDESVIFRRVVRVPPGIYTVSYHVRDILGQREDAAQGIAVAPRFGGTSVSQPLVVYEATPRKQLADIPQFLPAPRAAATFGTDANIPVYLEAYGTQITTPVGLTMRDQKGNIVWRDTAWLAQRHGLASGVVNIPLAQADIGVFSLTVSRPGGTPGDSARTSVFVGFGPDLPVVSFDDMVSYLRYFAASSRLQELESASGAQRAAAWRAFVQATDPDPQTPQNEALQDYFRRIRDANVLFRTDGTEGWLSDRGEVYVALGEPDDHYEREGRWAGYSPTLTSRARFLIWEYRDLQASIIFYDETGSGQWRFVPSSENTFRTLVARRAQYR
jgi:GWxTD domain-containing protein